MPDIELQLERMGERERLRERKFPGRNGPVKEGRSRQGTCSVEQDVCCTQPTGRLVLSVPGDSRSFPRLSHLCGSNTFQVPQGIFRLLEHHSPFICPHIHSIAPSCTHTT